MRRGVITRTRPAVGAHPAPGDVLFFAPPLVITEAEIDRLVSAARDAVEVVLSAVRSSTATLSELAAVKIDFQATTQCEAGALSDFLGRMFPHAERCVPGRDSTWPGSTGRPARTGRVRAVSPPDMTAPSWPTPRPGRCACALPVRSSRRRI